MATLIENRLEQWKAKLLDLSYRNPFLNFKHPELAESKRSSKRDVLSLRIVQESPAELLRLLYSEQSALYMLPWSEATNTAVPAPQPLTTINPGELLECYTDEGIQTTILEERLLTVVS